MPSVREILLLRLNMKFLSIYCMGNVWNLSVNRRAQDFFLFFFFFLFPITLMLQRVDFGVIVALNFIITISLGSNSLCTELAMAAFL
ncbi:hypothetical protein BGZ63DRAFT_393086 [Mariannaea sp. PMI_226]|nr:hypothetical protein BGZ63DRAFT_393086 [Mariannaea sp. PMI_226]